MYHTNRVVVGYSCSDLKKVVFQTACFSEAIHTYIFVAISTIKYVLQYLMFMYLMYMRTYITDQPYLY